MKIPSYFSFLSLLILFVKEIGQSLGCFIRKQNGAVFSDKAAVFIV